MKHIDLGNDDELDPDKTEAIPPSDVPSLSHAETQAHAASEKWADDLVRKVTTPPPLEKQLGGAEDVVSLLRDARVISAVAAAADAAIKSRDAVSTKPADSTTLGDVVASITLLSGTVGQVLSAVHGVNPNQYTSPIGPSAPPQYQYTSPIGPSLPPAPPAGGPPLPSGPQPVPPGGGGPIINAPPRHRQIMDRRKRRSSMKKPQLSTVMQHGGSAMAGFAKAGVAGAIAGFTFSLANGTKAVNRFESELNRAAQGFEKFAPQTQKARANQQVTEIGVEMRRGQALDARMAEFVTLQTEVSASFEDFKTRLFKILLDVFVPVMRGIWDAFVTFWEWIRDYGLQLADALDKIATTLMSIALVGEAAGKGVSSIANMIRELLKKAEEDGAIRDPFIDQLLNMQVPMYAAPKPFRRNRNRPRGMGAIP